LLNKDDLHILEWSLTDRGSKYAVSGGRAASKVEVLALLKMLKKNKKFAKATHNSWGLLLPGGDLLKSDDGEGGAGLVIGEVLRGAGLEGVLVIVTRWYGGVHLGGDRFRHVRSAAQAFVADFR